MESENDATKCAVAELESAGCKEEHALTATKAIVEMTNKYETIEDSNVTIQNKCDEKQISDVSTSETNRLETDETNTQASKEDLIVINNDMSHQGEIVPMEQQESTKEKNTTADAPKKDTVIIESVIQLVPATTESNSVTTSVEVQVELQQDKSQTLDAGVIEKMDITQTAISDHNVDLCVESSGDHLGKDQASISVTNKVDATATTSLALLSQYGENSDDEESNESETGSVVEVPTSTSKIYRSQVVEIDSDSTETISSDSESETEAEYLTKIAKTIEKRIAPNDDDDDEDDDDDNGEGGTKKQGRRQPPRVRGEMLLDDLPPIQDLQISVPAEECIEFGRVHSIVDQLLLVSALPNAILLDLETVLFLEQGKRVLGEVFDVLGQVADPLYCVRFNTNQHIHDKGINVGDIVYVAPKTEYTQYVILSSLMKLRGSDASWENDIEPPPRYLDYSDDEEEREARQKLRKHRRQSIKEEPQSSDDDDADDMDNDPMKHSRKYDNSATAQQRQERAGNRERYNNRRGRQDNRAPRSHAPHNYQRQHNSSWHSHYNQQYQPRPRPPMHNYGSPYVNPNQQHGPFYRTPPPTQHANFNPYAHPPTHFQSPHMLPPPPAPQMSAPMQPMHAMPPQMHAIPPQPNMYVPNPFAFRPPTLSIEPKTEVPSAASEPSPPGAD